MCKKPILILFSWVATRARKLTNLILCTAIVCSLTACAIPVLESAKTFRFELEGFANGRPFAFQQYYTCHQTAVLSAADGGYHKQWSGKGSGTQVGQVSHNLFIIYNAWGCDSAVQKQSVIAAVDSVENPTRLHLFRVLPTEPLITITKDRSVPVDGANVSLGPPSSQIKLKELLRERQRGFQRVTARIIPYEIFATSEEAKAFFDNLTEVTVATHKDSKLTGSFVFPFRQERDFAKLRISSEYQKVLAPPFNGEEFVFENRQLPPSDIFYSTPATRKTKSPDDLALAQVRYKNARFEVRRFLEVYDPKLKAIIVFYNDRRPYPWSSPEEEDIKRLSARKGW